MITAPELAHVLTGLQAPVGLQEQGAALRAAVARAYACGLIDSALLVSVMQQVEHGACRAAAESLVPSDLRFGAWRSATGWQAEVDNPASVEDWLNRDPIGYAVGCGSDAGAIAMAALRAIGFRENIDIYGLA